MKSLEKMPLECQQGGKKALNVTGLMGDAAPERPQRELMASDTARLAPIWPPTLPFKPLFFQMYSARVTASYSPHDTLPFSRGTAVFLPFFHVFLQRWRVSDTVLCNGVKALSDGLLFLRRDTSGEFF